MGVFAGLLVQLVFPSDRKYFKGVISAGIVGAFVGGILYSAFQIGAVSMSIDPGASFVALFGSLVLIYFIKALVRAEKEFEE